MPRLSETALLLFSYTYPPTILALIYLYFYPVFLGCSFSTTSIADDLPIPSALAPIASVPLNAVSGFVGLVARFFPILTQLIAGFAPNFLAAALTPSKSLPPFRLLALADPQIEAYPEWSWLGGPEGRWFSPRGEEQSAAEYMSQTLATDVARIVRFGRKNLDIWGTDIYLSHVYRTLGWWSKPTHTVVLGDLVSSQWIDDAMYSDRARRFWQQVFADGDKVTKDIADENKDPYAVAERLGSERSEWTKKIIAVAGNHDIGYAGDLTSRRIERFEKFYGPVNWARTFAFAPNVTDDDVEDVHTPKPELTLVISNSMNLDEPALEATLQQESRDFLNQQFKQPRRSDSATIFHSHIPLHKSAGVCADAPFFDLFPQNEGGGIREQNHLSEQTSQWILNGLHADGKKGKALIVNGHDHSGCEVLHSRLPSGKTAADEADGRTSVDGVWAATPYNTSVHSSHSSWVPTIREVTVRSMMGSYNANGGLVSAWFDEDKREWQFAHQSCAPGPGHLWWAVHVQAIVVAALGVLGTIGTIIKELDEDQERTARVNEELRTMEI